MSNTENRNNMKTLILTMLMVSGVGRVLAQGDKPMVRMAKIVVDSAQLDSYRAALKEGIEAAVRVEPGVLTLFAVYDKEHPFRVTVFEVYRDEVAYRAHLETPHFKKYKSTTKDMVRSLELVDVAPIALETKMGRASH